MRTLQQCLAEYPLPLLEGIAHSAGLTLIARDAEEAATTLATHMMTADVLNVLVAQLSSQARTALAHVRSAQPPLTWTTFVRRYGPLREMGPQRLIREQPWRTPQSPAEELVYRGLVFRSMVRRGTTVTEVVYIPPELALLLPPLEESAPDFRVAPAEPASSPHREGDAFLEDMVTLLAYAYNEGIQVDWEGRPLRGDLARLGERLIHPLTPEELRHPPPRVHLLFHHAYALRLLVQQGSHLHINPRPLSRWLKQPRAYQRFLLWRAWAESPRWNDLWHVPELECVQGPWENRPQEARQRVLQYLQRLEKDTWYTLDDFVQAVYEHDPDFQRQAGDYASWLIRRRGETDLLRGFEHWHEVEGRLLRFYIAGPMAWLDAILLDAAEAPSRFALSEAGYRWLHRRSEPMTKARPHLRVTPDFRVHLPHGAHPFDRFRVTRFADWEATHPEFVYRISRKSLARAAAQGIPTRRILAFLKKSTNKALPPNVARALARWHPESHHPAQSR